MSIKHSVLAIVAAAPTSGYQIKKAFEELTGGIWPLNDGQIYTTLGRLERDALVRSTVIEDQKLFEATPAGLNALRVWMAEPREPNVADRDELTLKVAFALRHPDLMDADTLRSLLDEQRVMSTAALQRLVRAKRSLSTEDAGQMAVIEAAVQRVTAEMRWLEVIDAHLASTPPIDTEHRETDR